MFSNSLSDFFDNQVPAEWRADAWAIIKRTTHLDHLILTKRPQNIHKMLPDDWGMGWKNVWLGTTAENQTEYDRRWPQLHTVPATVRFVSYEPALGPLRIDGSQAPDWIIVGGESGANRRPFDLVWAESLREHCSQIGTSIFFKQDSSFKPGQRGRASDALWNCKQFPRTP